MLIYETFKLTCRLKIITGRSKGSLNKPKTSFRTDDGAHLKHMSYWMREIYTGQLLVHDEDVTICLSWISSPQSVVCVPYVRQAAVNKDKSTAMLFILFFTATCARLAADQTGVSRSIGHADTERRIMPAASRKSRSAHPRRNIVPREERRVTTHNRRMMHRKCSHTPR